MLFWKRVKQKINGKWYPHTIVIGKTAGTQEVAERLARESTVSPADVHAVIRALPTVMAEIMAESRSVNLEGLGSFHFTAQATGKGVETEDQGERRPIHLRSRAIHPRPPKARHRLHPQPRGERILHGVERPGAKARARRRQREPRRDLIPPTRDKERERQDPACLSLSLSLDPWHIPRFR